MAGANCKCKTGVDVSGDVLAEKTCGCGGNGSKNLYASDSFSLYNENTSENVTTASSCACGGSGCCN
ncbi:MAG: hypothetical protein N2319_12975 [Candidatus Kapabacteria bacterium]|nr:hypothetical protein [Candidatus Kapabacteria bacterium]